MLIEQETFQQQQLQKIIGCHDEMDTINSALLIAYELNDKRKVRVLQSQKRQLQMKIERLRNQYYRNKG